MYLVRSDQLLLHLECKLLQVLLLLDLSMWVCMVDQQWAVKLQHQVDTGLAIHIYQVLLLRQHQHQHQLQQHLQNNHGDHPVHLKMHLIGELKQLSLTVSMHLQLLMAPVAMSKAQMCSVQEV